MLQSGGDECVNFVPPVLVYKSLIPDRSFDELRFRLGIVSGCEVLLSAVGAVTVKLYPGCG